MPQSTLMSPFISRATELQGMIMERIKTSAPSDLVRLAGAFERLERMKIRIQEASRKGHNGKKGISFSAPTVSTE